MGINYRALVLESSAASIIAKIKYWHTFFGMRKFFTPYALRYIRRTGTVCTGLEHENK